MKCGFQGIVLQLFLRTVWIKHPVFETMINLLINLPRRMESGSHHHLKCYHIIQDARNTVSPFSKKYIPTDLKVFSISLTNTSIILLEITSVIVKLYCAHTVALNYE